MANKSTVPFQGTKEQETVLREVIEREKRTGALMAVLQQAQEIMDMFLRKYRRLFRMRWISRFTRLKRLLISIHSLR